MKREWQMHKMTNSLLKIGLVPMKIHTEIVNVLGGMCLHKNNGLCRHLILNVVVQSIENWLVETPKTDNTKYGTQLAHNVFTPISWVKMWYTWPCKMPMLSTLNRQSFSIQYITFLIIYRVVELFGEPLQSSSSMFISSHLNSSTHLQTNVFEVTETLTTFTIHCEFSLVLHLF